MTRRQLRIADLILTLKSREVLWEFPEDSAQRSFEVVGCEQEEDLSLAIHWTPYSGTDLGEELLSLANAPEESPPVARLYRDKRGLWAIEANDPDYSVYRRRVGIFEPDFARGELYVEVREQGLSVYPNPFTSPLDRVALVNLLARRSGLLAHAGGAVWGGRAIVFLGSSGSGKSTMARLWSGLRDATVLGEECMAIRLRGSQFWAYGTPWIGESRSFSSHGAPLAGLFFLRHAAENRLERVAHERATRNLLARSFLTAYDPATADRGLELAVQLPQTVPVYEFHFVPDQSAVECMCSVV